MTDAVVKKPDDEKAQVEYDVAGQKIKLTVGIVRRFFCPEADELSAMTFMGFARAHSLDPFAKDCFLSMYKDGDGNPRPQITVAYQVFMRKAESHKGYSGFVAGTILQKTAEATIELEGEPGVVPKPLVACPGEFVPDGYVIIGGWCKVHRKDRTDPIVSTVSLKDYDKGRATWKTLKATMIRKCGIAHSFRDAFPGPLGRLYLQEEFAPEIDVKQADLPQAQIAALPTHLEPLFDVLDMNTANREMFMAERLKKTPDEIQQELEKLVAARAKPAGGSTTVVATPADAVKAGAAAMMAATTEGGHVTAESGQPPAEKKDGEQLALTDF